MENEQTVVAETEVTAEAETTEVTTDSTVKLTDEEKLARLEGGAKRLRKKLGLSEEPAKKEEVKKVENKKSDELLLEKLEKVTLRSEGITHPDDVELARNTAKKWGVDVDEVVADEDFKVKLERQQTARANVAATAGVKGGGGGSDAKNTPEYWISKGAPPTAEQVPNRKVRATIVRAMMAGAKTSGKKFYND